ncbi:MAG TPA: ATP phosphoribosyltransferase regulatory subunit, partial [Nitrospiria bacterium]
ILKEWAVPVQKAGRFSKILSLIGQDEVMEKALLLAETAQCRAAIRRLKEVYRILKGEGWGKRLVVDLAEVQGADYYTGVMFEVFSEQVGVPLGRGGRYDTLVGKFGTSCPATGFAFNMESLQQAMEIWGERNGQLGADLLLIGSGRELVRLFKTAGEIRGRGLSVIQQVDGTDLAQATAWARDAGIPNLLALINGNRAVLVSVKSGRRQTGRLPGLLSRLKPRRGSKNGRH